MSDAGDIAALKDVLRAHARGVRAAIPASARAAAALRLAGTFAAAFSFPAGTVVAGFWPLRDELDPRPLLAALRQTGSLIALPVTGEKRSALTFRLWAEGARLVHGRFGALIPADGGEEVAPDVVLTPLLAFDRAGGRLGYGGGYYDRTIGALREAKPVFAVGLAFAAQETASVPTGPYDRPLDAVVTEREVLSFKQF